MSEIPRQPVERRFRGSHRVVSQRCLRSPGGQFAHRLFRSRFPPLMSIEYRLSAAAEVVEGRSAGSWWQTILVGLDRDGSGYGDCNVVVAEVNRMAWGGPLHGGSPRCSGGGTASLGVEESNVVSGSGSSFTLRCSGLLTTFLALERKQSCQLASEALASEARSVERSKVGSSALCVTPVDRKLWSSLGAINVAAARHSFDMR